MNAIEDVTSMSEDTVEGLDKGQTRNRSEVVSKHPKGCVDSRISELAVHSSDVVVVYITVFACRLI